MKQLLNEKLLKVENTEFNWEERKKSGKTEKLKQPQQWKIHFKVSLSALQQTTTHSITACHTMAAASRACSPKLKCGQRQSLTQNQDEGGKASLFYQYRLPLFLACVWASYVVLCITCHSSPSAIIQTWCPQCPTTAHSVDRLMAISSSLQVLASTTLKG